MIGRVMVWQWASRGHNPLEFFAFKACALFAALKRTALANRRKYAMIDVPWLLRGNWRNVSDVNATLSFVGELLLQFGFNIVQSFSYPRRPGRGFANLGQNAVLSQHHVVAGFERRASTGNSATPTGRHRPAGRAASTRWWWRVWLLTCSVFRLVLVQGRVRWERHAQAVEETELRIHHKRIVDSEIPAGVARQQPVAGQRRVATRTMTRVVFVRTVRAASSVRDLFEEIAVAWKRARRVFRLVLFQPIRRRNKDNIVTVQRAGAGLMPYTRRTTHITRHVVYSNVTVYCVMCSRLPAEERRFSGSQLDATTQKTIQTFERFETLFSEKTR